MDELLLAQRAGGEVTLFEHAPGGPPAFAAALQQSVDLVPGAVGYTSGTIDLLSSGPTDVARRGVSNYVAVLSGA